MKMEKFIKDFIVIFSANTENKRTIQGEERNEQYILHRRYLFLCLFLFIDAPEKLKTNHRKTPTKIRKN